MFHFQNMVWNRLEHGNHRNSMVDLQCQGQPAESPEDAASFVSDSSTEDLPESPTDAVSGAVSVGPASAHRSGHGSMAGHLTPGSILSVAGSAPAVTTRYAAYAR